VFAVAVAVALTVTVTVTGVVADVVPVVAVGSATDSNTRTFCIPVEDTRGCARELCLYSGESTTLLGFPTSSSHMTLPPPTPPIFFNPHQMDTNVFLFRRIPQDAVEEGCGGGVEVLVARSTAGLRKRLLDADVTFSCPLNPDLVTDDEDRWVGDMLVPFWP
jgi:hypothetical protein